MIGTLTVHREHNPRMCDQCKHPSVGRLRTARYIWKRPGFPAVYLCAQHGLEVRNT